MKYRKLGRTGFEVSDIAYGLWGISGWSGSDDKESLASLQLSVDLGCNFFDTAWAYGEGKSDGLLGETMQRNKGKRLYAASKIPPANDRWPALPEYKYRDVFSAKHVFKYADLIRKQLRVDSIDVLQFHVWDDSWTKDPEFRSTVEKLKNEDLVRVRREGTFLWYSANTEALQDLLSFLYAECCTRNKAIEPQKIVCCK